MGNNVLRAHANFENFDALDVLDIIGEGVYIAVPIALPIMRRGTFEQQQRSAPTPPAL